MNARKFWTRLGTVVETEFIDGVETVTLSTSELELDLAPARTIPEIDDRPQPSWVLWQRQNRGDHYGRA